MNKQTETHMDDIYYIKDFYNVLHYIQDKMTQKLSSSALIQTVEYLMFKNKNRLNEWFIEYRYELMKFLTDDNEYITIFELFPNKDETIIDSVCRFHPINNIIGKNNEYINDYLNKQLYKELKTNINFFDITKKAWDVGKKDIDSKTLSSNYNEIEYVWYSVLLKKNYVKKAIIKIIQINDRYFLLLCGIYNLDYVKKENKILKNLLLILILIISVAIYWIRVKDFNYTGLIIYGIIALYTSFVVFYNQRKSQNYEFEVKQREDINQIALSIGSVICALIVITKIMKVSDDSIKLKFRRNLIANFCVLLFTLLIQPYDNTGKAVFMTVNIQKFLLLICFFVVLMTIISYIFHE